MLVDKIAHSPYANNTLIFVIEDDPQDGADRVSGNRSLGYVIGPYVKHNAVVSTRYATVNMLRTIEEVLGISKLSVHDSGVPPMTDAFDTNQATWTYSAVPAQILYTTTLPNSEQVCPEQRCVTTSHARRSLVGGENQGLRLQSGRPDRLRQIQPDHLGRHDGR